MEEIDSIILSNSSLILVLKKARHLVIDREVFVDWNKFISFVHSTLQ